MSNNIKERVMKNVFLLPTDKPSRLHLGNSGLILCDLIFNSGTINSQHIYITNDEEIKEGDWFLDTVSNTVHKAKLATGVFNTRKKIILTTDQDLIADGVQAIDDEFLEWFVNNPSCESVEVQKWFDGIDFLEYKIIIPKQELERGITITHFQQYPIEVIAANLADPNICKTDNWIAGAKWQQERMYSEEEVRELLTQRSKHFGTNVKPFNELLLKQDLEWFEENKK